MLTRKRTQKIKRYAKEFCKQVYRDYGNLGIVDATPVIKCYRGIYETYDGTQIDGALIHSTGIVEIYNITKERPEALKQTVRHECLHFLLRKSNLPFEDDTEIFCILALNYNAFPYGNRKFITRIIDAGADENKQIQAINQYTKEKGLKT